MIVTCKLYFVIRNSISTSPSKIIMGAYPKCCLPGLSHPEPRIPTLSVGATPPNTHPRTHSKPWHTTVGDLNYRNNHNPHHSNTLSYGRDFAGNIWLTPKYFINFLKMNSNPRVYTSLSLLLSTPLETSHFLL